MDVRDGGRAWDAEFDEISMERTELQVEEADFIRLLAKRKFYSFDQFEEALKEYEVMHNVSFVRTVSTRCANARLRYSRVFYQCSRRPARASQSRGIRRTL